MLVIVLTGLYTTLGGMRAVAYNDAVQVIVLIVGSALLTVLRPVKPGRLERAAPLVRLRHVQSLEAAHSRRACKAPGRPSLRDQRRRPGGEAGLVFQRQFPVARHAVLRARSSACGTGAPTNTSCSARWARPTKRSPAAAAFSPRFSSSSPSTCSSFPGLICFALAKSGKVPELAVDDRARRPGHSRALPKGAFPMMVQYLLPPGLRGIVVAGLLSALMGSLAGVFNACSTLFTVDLYEKWKPQATQHQLVRTGRIATAVMVLIALAWIPVIKDANGLYDYLQAVQGYLAPPIFVVFFFGVFFKRMNAQGALWAMVVGFVLGIFRMLVDTPVTLGLDGLRRTATRQGSFLWIVNNIYFQYFSVLITLVSAVVMVA